MPKTVTIVGFRMDRSKSVGYRKFGWAEAKIGEMGELDEILWKKVGRFVRMLIEEKDAKVISIRVVEDGGK